MRSDQFRQVRSDVVCGTNTGALIGLNGANLFGGDNGILGPAEGAHDELTLGQAVGARFDDLGNGKGTHDVALVYWRNVEALGVHILLNPSGMMFSSISLDIFTAEHTLFALGHLRSRGS